MANHLKIFGVDVPVASASRSLEYAGQAHARQFSGQAIRTTQARKNVYSFTTPPISQTDSQAFQKLIMGEGYYFPIRNPNFSGDYGTTQGHFSTSVGTHTAFGSEAMFPGPNGAPDANKYFTRAYVQLPTGITSWTIMGNFYGYDSSARRHIITSTGSVYNSGSPLAAANVPSMDRVTYDSTTGLMEFKGAQYHPITGAPNGGADWTATTARGLGSRCFISGQNRTAVVTTAGTTGASQPTFSATIGGTVTDGTVVWTTRHTGASGNFVQNAFFLPYVVPSTWIAGLDAFLATSMGSGFQTPANAGGDPALPNVVCSGTGFPVTAVCRGEITGIESITGPNGTILEAISFTLWEV